MDLNEKVIKLANKFPNLQNGELAKKIYSQLSESEIIHLLSDCIRNILRHETRLVEHKAFHSNISFNKDLPDINGMVDEDAQDLFKAKFALGNDRYVSWGEATAEQHKQRIAFLSKLRDGIDQTINRHQQAIEQIKKHNVKCLNQIKNLVLV